MPFNDSLLNLITIPASASPFYDGSLTIKMGDMKPEVEFINGKKLEIKETYNAKIVSSIRIPSNPNEIIRIKVLAPEKVLLFTFPDGKEIKTVCSKDDVFDFDVACYLAIAKRKYGDKLTIDGCEKLAREVLPYVKEYVDIVKAAKKTFKIDQESIKKLEEYEASVRAKRLKRKQKKEARSNKKREERINILAEAIKRAKE